MIIIKKDTYTSAIILGWGGIVPLLTLPAPPANKVNIILSLNAVFRPISIPYNNFSFYFGIQNTIHFEPDNYIIMNVNTPDRTMCKVASRLYFPIPAQFDFYIFPDQAIFLGDGEIDVFTAYEEKPIV